MRRFFFIALFLIFWPLQTSPALSSQVPVVAETSTPAQPSRSREPADPMVPGASMCKTLEAAAQENELPVAFLTRLIWQESRFEPRAVSPAGARGVAQFMPQTAAIVGLADPFDVAEAIGKSARLLRDLNQQFGNLGLAAAAYNAGPRRVQDWLAGRGGLPAETMAYVQIVTGHDADAWRAGGQVRLELPAPNAALCPQIRNLLPKQPESASPQIKAKTAPASPPPKAAWGLQLTGGPSQSEALSSYVQMQKAYPSVLSGRPPLVLRSSLGRGRSWYRVRAAVDTLIGAKRLCSDLRALGGSCIIQRN